MLSNEGNSFFFNNVILIVNVTLQLTCSGKGLDHFVESFLGVSSHE